MWIIKRLETSDISNMNEIGHVPKIWNGEANIGSYGKYTQEVLDSVNILSYEFLKFNLVTHETSFQNSMVGHFSDSGNSRK